MADIWLVSDTHFGHKNIISYSNRPYKDVEEMDWDMVEKWNSVVKDGDKVYHLGDVYMGGQSREYINNILSHLKGQKRLILGNHDNGKDQILQNHFKKIDVWRMFKEFGLLLTHVPVHPSSAERIEHSMVWNNGTQQYEPKEKKYFLKNIHGHTHTNAEPDGDTKRYKCVCVELINYTPVNIEELRII
jgi:calcineurin-like phosphoesterase family protein